MPTNMDKIYNMKNGIKFVLFILLILTMVLQGCASHGKAKQNLTANYASGNYRLVYNQLSKLAESGDPEAQYGVGYLYFYGIGVPQDHDTARYWIHRSMAAGYPPAIEAYRKITVDDNIQKDVKELKVRNF